MVFLYAEHPDIGKLDTYFFSIAFLYRHCMEVGLKAIGFQYIDDVVERKNFVKETRHNLSEIFNVIVNKSDSMRPVEELEWLKKYFDDLSQTDRESDSFRYPFHIVWELDEWEGKFVIKPIFIRHLVHRTVKRAYNCRGERPCHITLFRSAICFS